MVQEVKEADRAALTGHLKGLTDITTSHQEGGTAYARLIGMSLFEDFLDVEERFQRGIEATEQEIIDELRQVSCLALFVMGAYTACAALLFWHLYTMLHLLCCDLISCLLRCCVFCAIVLTPVCCPAGR